MTPQTQAQREVHPMTQQMQAQREGQREVGVEADGILNSGWPGRGLCEGRVAL